MFTSIANAVKAMCTAIITLANASNKVAMTVDNLASVAEETSRGYLDETRVNRIADLQELEKTRKVKAAA